MNAKRIIEIFTAGCPVCDETVKQVTNALGNECDITVYDLNKGCETNVCRDKAREYGIKAVPSVAIDGVLADRCSHRGVEIEAIKQKCGLA